MNSFELRIIIVYNLYGGCFTFIILKVFFSSPLFLSASGRRLLLVVIYNNSAVAIMHKVPTYIYIFISLLIYNIIKYCQTLLECLEGRDKTQIVETIEIESTDNKSSDIWETNIQYLNYLLLVKCQSWFLANSNIMILTWMTIFEHRTFLLYLLRG